MDFVITFFRDIVDGPLYIVVAIISVILICSCIGYLAETSINKKKAKQEYDESHADVSNSSPVENNLNPEPNKVEDSINVNTQVPPTMNSTVPEMGTFPNRQIQNPTNIGMNGNVAFQQMGTPNINQPSPAITQTMSPPIPQPTVTTPPLPPIPGNVEDIPKI